MSFSLKTQAAIALDQPTLSFRLRYYGFCTVVALAFMIMGQRTDDFDGWAQVYLPSIGATVLVIGLAGVEYHLFLRRVSAERESQLATREEAELQAIERQRTFNRIWQDLADCRGSGGIPVTVLTELVRLFSADLVAAWSSDNVGGFHLAGAHPLANDGAVRLDKVAQMSPCFERLREKQRVVCVSNLDQETTRAFAWFCEENGLPHAILCPVLVRRDLVGVLVFFYREKPQVTSKVTEEMQAAANLFLCAF
jgi:GAF domain